MQIIMCTISNTATSNIERARNATEMTKCGFTVSKPLNRHNAPGVAVKTSTPTGHTNAMQSNTITTTGII